MSTERWANQVGAYVLDSLDADERAAFEAQLARDAELRRLVDEARASTVVLAESLPDLEPPEHLRERVLERMRTAKGTAGPRVDEEAAGERDRSPGRASSDDRPTGSAPTDDRSTDRAPTHRSRGKGRSTIPWLLLAASVAGLLWLGYENRDLTRRSATLAAQLDSMRTSLGDARQALARFDSLALALSGPNVQLATLTGEADPSLRLVWNRDRDLLLVSAANLPPLAEGRTFQLWGIRGDEAPVSLGTFDTDAEGDALVTLPATATEDYDVSAVTDEPAGGSPQPTTQPFLVGAWSSAQ